MFKKTLWVIGLLAIFAWTALWTNLTYENFFTQYFNEIEISTPDSYQYIQLQYKNIPQEGDLYHALQKWVYLWMLPNGKINLPLAQTPTQEQVAHIVWKTLGAKVMYKEDTIATQEWFDKLMININEQIDEPSSETSKQQQILADVYATLEYNYINPNDIDREKLEYGAIKGMVEAVDDKYTSYFPPVEAKDFQEWLEGKFEGIGAYVDLPEPGKFIIISPLKGSPAEDAGLEGWDIITHIDSDPITDNMDIQSIIHKIKGPAGTKVNLTILRGSDVLNKTVTRDKIIMIDIEHQVRIDNNKNTCYVQINMFNFWLYERFKTTLDELEDEYCNKYIFDLRNNPGGSLQEVAAMLDHFVPTGEASVIVKTRRETEVYTASEASPKLTNKKIIILLNKGSASASEVFAGTIKDYGKDVVIIGEESFGKGSVQNLKTYPDGSMLKITIAKRYTGKTETNVDHDGIDPDIEIINDEKMTTDEQLEAAKKYNF